MLQLALFDERDLAGAQPLDFPVRDRIGLLAGQPQKLTRGVASGCFLWYNKSKISI